MGRINVVPPSIKRVCSFLRWFLHDDLIACYLGLRARNLCKKKTNVLGAVTVGFGANVRV